jgi:hypothetical protein
MWRSKKFILVTVLVAVLLVGSIGGIVFAADSGDNSQFKARHDAMLDKVCEIYQQKTGVAIDKEALKESFAQAMSELRPAASPTRPERGPQAMQDRLQNLVTDGKLTREQADAFQKWWESRPDVPLGFGPPGPGGFHGKGGPCIPPPPPPAQ